MKGVATSAGEGVTFSVNAQWEGWFTETPRTQDWQNRIPNGTGRNNAGMGFVRTGNRSMELSRGFATFTAAVYQTVNVPENANLTGGGYVVMNISGPNAADANSVARVGIDPTGGTNPYAASVIWSSTATNALASNGFRELTVNATAQGTRVTLFLFATQTVPTEGNSVFWDDAYLRVGGPGGGAAPAPGATGVPPTPTPVPLMVVPFVSPQGEQADGSIIHTVQENDTLSSISVAYGVPMDTIRELNPEIGQGRFLDVGQRLIIRRATSGLGPSGPINPPQTEVQPTVEAQLPTVEQPPVVQPPVTQAVPAVRLGSLFFFTNDLDATREFYGTVLGLEEIARDDITATEDVEFDLGGVRLVFLLTENEIPATSAWARQSIYDGGTVDESSLIISVTGENFEAMIGRIVGAGISVYNDAILVPQVGQRAVFLRDPMGNTIAILTEDA
jgi:extradiol dioxygenase family protein/LysM repeat protein